MKFSQWMYTLSRNYASVVAFAPLLSANLTSREHYFNQGTRTSVLATGPMLW